jgi:hypothetical protein
LNPGGILIIIETLGTNTHEPSIRRQELKEMYDILELQLGFIRDVIRTDYRFTSVQEAKRIMGFFFGMEMGNSVVAEVVPEFTGVWHRRR